MKRKHDTEGITCPLVPWDGNYHFELRCEDCDVWRMSRATLDQVDAWHFQGRITQDDFEAYTWLHGRLSPYSRVGPVPEIPAVRRIARKLLAARPELPSLPELNEHDLAA